MANKILEGLGELLKEAGTRAVGEAASSLLRDAEKGTDEIGRRLRRARQRVSERTNVPIDAEIIEEDDFTPPRRRR